MEARTPPGRRVALVHDFLLDLRGAERVFLELCALWPEAPIFTAVYDEDGTEGRFAEREVNTSFLQRLRPSARTFRGLLPFYPAAVESFDLSGFDLVVSSSSAKAGSTSGIPRTGFPVGMLLFAGALLLCGGLALRRVAGTTHT